MTKKELKALIKEVISETNEGVVDKNFKVGDTFLGKDVYRFGGNTWMHIYKVLAVEKAMRFGKPDQLLTVKITTTTGNVVDEKTKRWASQLF